MLKSTVGISHGYGQAMADNEKGDVLTEDVEEHDEPRVLTSGGKFPRGPCGVLHGGEINGRY